jgi:hypothetical protein
MDDDWVPPLPAGYHDANRAFIQAFMARGTLTFREAQKLLAAIRTASNPSDPPTSAQSITMSDFENVLRTAREAVEPLDFDIRNTRDQVRGGSGSGERVWVFINAHSDPATQMATARSPDEVAYVKRLLDAMFDTYNTPRMEVMAVDEGQAIGVCRPARRESNMNGGGDGEAEEEDGEGGEGAVAGAGRALKHSEVLSLLASLVAEGWLDKSRDGFYSLTPRSLVELWSWLVTTYNDLDSDSEWQRIKFCEACKEIVTYGQRCNEPDCTVRLHDICEEGFWRMRGDKKCPKCKREWDGSHFVGERAVTSRSGFKRGRGIRGRRSEAEAAQDEDEDEE